jgi:hypothetical protein
MRKLRTINIGQPTTSVEDGGLNYKKCDGGKEERMNCEHMSTVGTEVIRVFPKTRVL